MIGKRFRKFVNKIEVHRDTPRIFTMIIKKDETGVSGPGRVLDGIIFQDGKTVIYWRSDKPSIAIYNSFKEFQQVHIESHPKNKTEIVWL